MLRTILAIALFSAAVSAAADAPRVIHAVTIDRSSFNPTLGERVEVQVTLECSGSIRVVVVDRDGYAVRTIADGPAAAGVNRNVWDGRGEGAVVPDEAYSLLIDWSAGSEKSRYFPADSSAPMRAIDSRYYSER